MKTVDIILASHVELVTRFKTYTYPAGPATVPMDLAKLLFKLKKAKPILPYKPTLTPISKR